ncbi:hypothetical protein PM10SUCC1_25010 [Propionigenium maris DSM 9537]|uniref:Zinc finger Ogr/Delta-type domain-containing protein n=1 Tax=Propionigenium maris DSM 9537 TaxID=1123000 RepID=A0A9W6LNW8_9FUSO|nr:hypothetical protein PM10SUCC1_25010 [Propionigenium maris DSM 9537]
MNCPNCNTKNTAYSSRTLYGTTKNRYYKCKTCQATYATRFQSSETLVSIREGKSV